MMVGIGGYKQSVRRVRGATSWWGLEGVGAMVGVCGDLDLSRLSGANGNTAWSQSGAARRIWGGGIA